MAARAQKLGAWDKLKREMRFLRSVRRTLARIKGVAPDSTTLICDDLEAAVDKYAQRNAMIFEGRAVTYAQLDAMANRFAHWATGRGIKKGDTVALFMPNRIEYVAIWYGLSKVGVATALVNNQLQGPSLVHCLAISGAAHVIVDLETLPVFEAVRGELPRSMNEWILGGSAAGSVAPVRSDRDLDRLLKGVSSLRPTGSTARYGITAKDTALYIYTSGTTGLPKAARIAHTRAQLYMRSFSASTEATPNDRIYCPLPLYHSTGGLCGVGAALLSGGTLVLKKRFSASQFWTDIAEQQCTMFVYIGELCRYLVNQPEREEERTPLKLAFGNGLRGEVWERMNARFKIDRIMEFYGATEGNAGVFNFDGKVGAVGRVPRYLRNNFMVRLIRVDPETGEPERDGRGLCIECKPGEVGEFIGKIGADARTSYTGYVDKAASEKKVLTDVFQRGDRWFLTGDLMKTDADGYFYFVDRVGDTFRWKGENVSTGEVQVVLEGAPGVQEANVYGVEIPGADGRAGMAMLAVGPEFDIAALQAKADADLPPYARPVFLRVGDHVEATGTFKHKKADLVLAGFDPALSDDPLYVREPGGDYIRLDAPAYVRLMGGEARL